MQIGYLNVFGGMFHLEHYKMTGAKLTTWHLNWRTNTSSRTDVLLRIYGRRNSNSSDSSTLSEEIFPLPDSGRHNNYLLRWLIK